MPAFSPQGEVTWSLPPCLLHFTPCNLCTLLLFVLSDTCHPFITAGHLVPASHSFTSGLGDVVLYLVLTILALMKGGNFFL